MKLQKVEYSTLSPKQQEIYNFQKVAALLADYGYNCIKLADDWQGADFLAYHKDGNSTLKVQLKGRLTIGKKYLDKEIYMAFPCNENWYLIGHDELVDIVKEISPSWLESESWQNNKRNSGSYDSGKPSKDLLLSIAHAKI